MHYIAIQVEFLEDETIELTYLDGRVVKYDLSILFPKYPQLEEPRKNSDLFTNGKLDPGGYGVICNDYLDIDTTGIFYDGEIVRYIETTINQKLGFLLTKTRDELNITQMELSKKSKIDQADISKIERGLGNPTLMKIDKLFKAMGKNISLNYL